MRILIEVLALVLVVIFVLQGVGPKGNYPHRLRGKTIMGITVMLTIPVAILIWSGEVAWTGERLIHISIAATLAVALSVLFWTGIKLWRLYRTVPSVRAVTMDYQDAKRLHKLAFRCSLVLLPSTIVSAIWAK